MNYERLRKNIVSCLYPYPITVTIIADEIIKHVKAEITGIIEECAKIAELYEPDEKLDYVAYASREIRRKMK